MTVLFAVVFVGTLVYRLARYEQNARGHRRLLAHQRAVARDQHVAALERELGMTLDLDHHEEGRPGQGAPQEGEAPGMGRTTR